MYYWYYALMNGQWICLGQYYGGDGWGYDILKGYGVTQLVRCRLK